jgi:ferric-dicitrate binding protein FerR (iron transport regulator)
MNIVMVKDGSRKKVSLPDGSEVWLNGGSRLIYSKGLGHCNAREVTLSGEGYFKVKHYEDCPFIIHTDYLDIKDLGTVF